MKKVNSTFVKAFNIFYWALAFAALGLFIYQVIRIRSGYSAFSFSPCYLVCIFSPVYKKFNSEKKTEAK